MGADKPVKFLSSAEFIAPSRGEVISCVPLLNWSSPLVNRSQTSRTDRLRSDPTMRRLHDSQMTEAYREETSYGRA